MLDNIKTTFSISDLQQLSGISSHTIRIWERRFDLLRPERTDSNIRQYNNEHLKKLLNISLLVRKGYKISELAGLSDTQLNAMVNSHTMVLENQVYLNQLKLSMMEFDTVLFNDIYSRLLSDMSFYELFIKVLVPFLGEIGNLWQTNSITVAQEHFISNLIKQKLYYNIDRLPSVTADTKERYILFLPVGEMHELGLLFLHYTLLMHGKDSVYLGQDVDHNTLAGIKRDGRKKIFISYFTLIPSVPGVAGFIKDISKLLLKDNNELWITGKQSAEVKTRKGSAVKAFPDVRDLLDVIKK